mgnify:FL=1
MTRPSNHIIIGLGGHVAVIDPGSGAEIWRTKLKGSSFVTISQTADRVYAGAGGELFCLDASSGSILWRNPLKGLGLGVVAFSNSGDVVLAAAEAAARAAANS